MEDAVEEFGVRVAGVEYHARPGGYVVLLNDAGEVAVITAQSGLFLPGGGQEGDETPADAAVREALEECGLRITLHEFVGIAGRTHLRDCGGRLLPETVFLLHGLHRRTRPRCGRRA